MFHEERIRKVDEIHLGVSYSGVLGQIIGQGNGDESNVTQLRFRHASYGKTLYKPAPLALYTGYKNREEATSWSSQGNSLRSIVPVPISLSSSTFSLL